MQTPPDVIWITLDTVRADRVSAHGHDRKTTPAFDEFADHATLYTDAVAQAPWSIPSHGSLFTGQYPADHGATTTSPVLQAGDTLPALLSAAGYETYAISPNEYVRPATGFGHGFDEFETLSPVSEPPAVADLLGPLLDRGAGNPTVRRPFERALTATRSCDGTTAETPAPADDGLVEQFRASLDRASSPFFLFVNLFDTHLPRSPAPRYQEQFVDDDLADVPVVTNERAYTFGDHEMGPRATRKMRQLYDADLRTMDDRLDSLLTALSEAGAFEDSLIALFADHGEHLGEFGLFGHQHSVFDSAVSVPLAVQFPGGGPDRVTEQVELRRLFGTTLDETGVESHPEQSLRSGGDDTARGSFYPPGVDPTALYWDGQISYDPDLLGEPITFARDGEAKRIEFAGEEWLFEVPEDGTESLAADAVPAEYDWPAPNPDVSIE
jgi:arylsulfatase A-like enzyme